MIVYNQLCMITVCYSMSCLFQVHLVHCMIVPLKMLLNAAIVFDTLSTKISNFFEKLGKSTL